MSKLQTYDVELAVNTESGRLICEETDRPWEDIELKPIHSFTTARLTPHFQLDRHGFYTQVTSEDEVMEGELVGDPTGPYHEGILTKRRTLRRFGFIGMVDQVRLDFLAPGFVGSARYDSHEGEDVVDNLEELIKFSNGQKAELLEEWRKHPNYIPDWYRAISKSMNLNACMAGYAELNSTKLIAGAAIIIDEVTGNKSDTIAGLVGEVRRPGVQIGDRLDLIESLVPKIR